MGSNSFDDDEYFYLAHGIIYFKAVFHTVQYSHGMSYHMGQHVVDIGVQVVATQLLSAGVWVGWYKTTFNRITQQLFNQCPYFTFRQHVCGICNSRVTDDGKKKKYRN
jgi:hypothetical protein